MIRTYRFYCDLGVPVYDWPTGKRVVSYHWRSLKRSVAAYSLTDATERLAKAVITKWSANATLHLTEAFVSNVCAPRLTHVSDWDEINLDAATLAAFVVGTEARHLLKEQLQA